MFSLVRPRRVGSVEKMKIQMAPKRMLRELYALAGKGRGSGRVRMATWSVRAKLMARGRTKVNNKGQKGLMLMGCSQLSEALNDGISTYLSTIPIVSIASRLTDRLLSCSGHRLE